MAEKNESEFLEEVAGRLNEVAQYLSQINRKLEDIDHKLAALIEKSGQRNPRRDRERRLDRVVTSFRRRRSTD